VNIFIAEFRRHSDAQAKCCKNVYCLHIWIFQWISCWI